MINPSTASIIVEDIILRLVLSVTTSVIWLFIVLAFIVLFRIKSPNVKSALLTVPLIKGLLAIIRDIPQYGKAKPGYIVAYFQMPDFGHLAPSLPWERADNVLGQYFSPATSLSPIALIIIVLFSLGFVVLRLIGMFRFLFMINQAEQLDRSENKIFFQILDRLVAKAKIKPPKIISIESSGTPFTVGIRRSIIAVSMPMMEKLEPAEIEAVLAHEISHITRKDHLFHWPIVILRDILFFNPVSHFLYPRIGFEKERACDQIVARQVKPLILAKSLVKIADMQSSRPPLTLVKHYAPQSLVGESGTLFTQRVKELVEQGSPFRMHGLFKMTFIIVSVLTLVIVDFRLITIFDRYLFVLS